MHQDEARGYGFASEGEQAPAFLFVDGGNGPISSSELLAKGPVLLTFYRGAWCPYCQSDLHDLAGAMDRIRATGTTVVGVFDRMDREARSRISERYAVKQMPLVGDPDGQIAESFGIRRSSDERSNADSSYDPELLALKGSEPWILPMQARFVITTDGMIAWSEIIFDYSQRSSVDILVRLLARLG